ncbi:hypothetical protein [Reinekea blandensis]|uniref:Glycosyl transferase, family 2 n=1 Tax=Reinekea blandensis MED297 TaxID=314283 RepID=A4BIX7_9GAMM|nr:hypothetical protein [Reinekea blandensis]EAR07910.1 Glycosyl transferase, family 2 [Reinekea sp. MED297] [Reinekea blandensis MED297]
MLMITHALEPEFGSSVMERFNGKPGVVLLDNIAQGGASGRVREFLAAEPSNRVLVFVDFAAERLGAMYQQEASVQQTAIDEWVSQAGALLEVHKQDRKRIRLVSLASAVFDPHALKDEFHITMELPSHSPEQALGMTLVEKLVTGDYAELDLHLRACTRTYNESALMAEKAKQAADFIITQQLEIATLQRALKAEAEEKQAITNDAEKRTMTLRAELKSVNASNKELNSENSLLLDQLHKVQEDLERKLLEVTEQEKLAKKNEKALQAKQNELVKEKASNDKAIERLKTQHAKELDSLDASLKAEKAKNKDLAEENDLILNQLHLVQEELERYYQELRSTKQLSDSHARKFEQLNESMKLQSRKHSRAQVQLNRVQNAFSWKVTKVFRSAIRLYPRVRLSEQVELLKASDLFDETWYLKTYPDVQKAGLDAAIHYLRHGAKEGRNPGPNFDTQWYLQQYPDVQKSKLNALVHYILYGIDENRKVSPRLLTHRA